jgi:hypothetical protein
VSRSPWQRVLNERMADLDTGLRAYFGTIPEGCVGRGHGVFSVVGTPRRWLWPAYALLARDGVLFPIWEHAVPFRVTNRPTSRGTVKATRVFEFAAGARTMSDEIGVTRSGLTHRLGRHGTVSAAFDAEVVEGQLVLRSTGAELRVTLVERANGDHQHVSLRLALPIVGTLYEYAGSFTYRIERDDNG